MDAYAFGVGRRAIPPKYPAFSYEIFPELYFLGYQQYLRVLLGQSQRLLKQRGNFPLPPGQEGRYWFQGLIILGLPRRHWRMWAPWATTEDAELCGGGCPMLLPKKERDEHIGAFIGRIFCVTDEERIIYELSHIRPFDRSWEVIVHERKAAKVARKREQRQLARNKWNQGATGRAEVVLSHVIRGPKSVPQLIQKLLREERPRSVDGRRLNPKSLSRIVRRILDQLVKDGLIGDEYRPGKRNRVRWVWRIADKRTGRSK